MKKCTKCKDLKDCSEFYYNKNQNTYSGMCKFCSREHNKKVCNIVENFEMEVWTTIKGFEKYKVSNFQRVKSIEKNGFHNEKLMKPTIDKDGYYTFILLNENRKPKRISLHRIVALTFIINIENKPQVNHINGIKTDNRVENLEWSTAKENVNHAWDNNLSKPRLGKNHHNSKLTEKDVLEIRKSNFSTKELSILYKVDYETIRNVITRRKWKHIE